MGVKTIDDALIAFSQVLPEFLQVIRVEVQMSRELKLAIHRAVESSR